VGGGDGIREMATGGGGVLVLEAKWFCNIALIALSLFENRLEKLGGA
jgi:hypothetical protein